MDTRSKTSPYSSSIVKIEFGSTKVPHFIPLALLQVPDWIGHGSKSGMYTICVPKVREEIGHILIHFMYTGKYQALLKENFNPIVDFREKSDFIMALRAIFDSETYHLPNLHKLAKAELVTHGEYIDISSKLQLIDHEIVTSRNSGYSLSTTSESRRWLNNYLKAELQAAYIKNEKILDGLSILDNIYDTPLIKSLAKFIFEIHSNQIQTLKKAEREVDMAKSDIDIGNPSELILGERSHRKYVSDFSLYEPNIFACAQNEARIPEKSIKSFPHQTNLFNFPQKETQNQVKLKDPILHTKDISCSQNEAENLFRFKGPLPDRVRTSGCAQNKSENQVDSTTPNSSRAISLDSVQQTSKFKNKSTGFSWGRTTPIDSTRNQKENKSKSSGPDISQTSFFGFGFNQDNAENEILTVDSDSSHTSTFIFTPVSPSDDVSLDEKFEKES